MGHAGSAYPEPDPLAAALRRKASTGADGSASRTVLASGKGWSAVDIVCTCGPRDPTFEERHSGPSISLVLAGTFACRSGCGSSLLSAGSLFLGSTGQAYECSHRDGEGDRCLSFHFDADVFERLAHDAGVARAGFDRQSMPPLRVLAGLTARAGDGAWPWSRCGWRDCVRSGRRRHPACCGAAEASVLHAAAPGAHLKRLAPPGVE
jgi:hypothetical protein